MDKEIIIDIQQKADIVVIDEKITHSIIVVIGGIGELQYLHFL